jgi:hypothetical protein
METNEGCVMTMGSEVGPTPAPPCDIIPGSIRLVVLTASLSRGIGARCDERLVAEHAERCPLYKGPSESYYHPCTLATNFQRL